MAALLDPRLQLQPAPLRTRVWLAALALVLPLGIIGATFALEADESGVAVHLGAAGFCALLFVVIDLALRRHRLVLGDGTLEVATTFYTRRLALAELRLDEARVLDLAERIEFKPVLRTNGVGLPGFASGWMRLRNRDKALVGLAGGTRVLWLPTTRGFGLLLQARQPQALLDRLRELAPVPPRR